MYHYVLLLRVVHRTDGINIIIDQLAVSGDNSTYARVYTVRKTAALTVCTDMHAFIFWIYGHLLISERLLLRNHVQRRSNFLFLILLFAEYCTVTPFVQDLPGLGHIAWCTVRSGCYWMHDYFLFRPFTVVLALLSHIVRFSHGRSSLILLPYLQFYFVRFKILPFSWICTCKSSHFTFPLYLLPSINSPLCGMKYENINLKFVTRSVTGYCCVILFVIRSPLRSCSSILYFWV